jgi:hypothetical protein
MQKLEPSFVGTLLNLKADFSLKFLQREEDHGGG